MKWLWSVFVILAIMSLAKAVAQDTDPGADNPIVPTARRTLFPDQHALIAMPQDPATTQTVPTYTDWARSEDIQTLQLQEAFANGLQGVSEARAAAGHILNQQRQQVAVGRFTGPSNTAANTLTVDVLTAAGDLEAGASTSLSAFSTNVQYSATNIANSFDIAVGELTTLTDEEGVGHAEVVACYLQRTAPVFNPELRARVTVLDYTNLAESGVITTTAGGGPDVTNLPLRRANELNFLTRNASDTSIACATGDVNGDGVDEIIVTYLFTTPAERQWVGVFRYSNDGESSPSLERIGAGVTLDPFDKQQPDTSLLGYNGSVDVATGDFDGNGRLDVAVSSVTAIYTFSGLVVNYPAVWVLSSDDALDLTVQSSFAAAEEGTVPANDLFNATGSYACNSGANSACEYMRASLVSGLFQFDPAADFDFNRRQLALVFNMPFANGGGLRASALTVSRDLQSITQLGDTVTLPQQSCGGSLCPSGQRFSVAAGGLVGSADVSDPFWSLAISNWETTQSGNASKQAKGQFHLFWLKAQPATSGNSGASELSLAWDAVQLGAADSNGPLNGRLPAVAWDRDGDSVWLGSPVHLVVYDYVDTDYIIQEPPKHTYWWPPSATQAGDGQVVNVSRSSDFFVELADEEGRDYSFVNKDQTDWTIGGSVALSGSASVTAGASAGILGSAKATASVSVQGKIGYDYNENKDDYESSYFEQNVKFSGQTNADDLLVVDLMLIDIWRYPVSGIDVEDGLNAFWEIALPGKTVTFQGGGLSDGLDDYYQPPHENGNILSYPALSGLAYTPEDCCGQFTFVENAQPVTEAVPFLDDRLLAFDGTSARIDLQFSQQAGEGSTKTYTDKLSASLDIQTGYKTEAKLLGQETKAETKVDVNFNNTNSWTNVSTSNATTNNSTGFTLQKPEGNFNQSYSFLPVFYLAQNGTTKVTHGVSVPPGGFWSDIYGQKPDPALNLPRRFSPVAGNWIVNTFSNAKKIRRFFVRFNTPDAADGFPLVGGAVTDGEEVRIEVDVYNYSIAEGFDNLGVAFEAVKYNSVKNEEGERVPLSCGPGSIEFLSVNPQARKTAVCVWDTTGFGPILAGALQEYRIYVTLDPNNTITNELYEGTVGPGQNNQGWGLVTVANPEETFRTSTPTDEVPRGGDVQLVTDSVALQVDGQMETGFARAVVDQVTPLRVCLNTDQTQTGYYHVLIWDGDPADGGQLLADKRVQGVDQNGDTCVWIENFRADEPGAWSIYAQVLETREDGLVGNAVDTLQVQVDDIPNLMPLRARGRASRVGVAEAVGAVVLTAVFPYGGELDLPGTTAVIASVLDEMAGSGELVPGIEEDAGQDLVLEPLWSSANIALFQTPQGQEPIVRLSLWRHKGALFVAFQVSKARILEPAFCGAATELSTDLLLLDAENPPVNLEITELWQCKTGPTGEVRELVLPGIW